MDSEFVALMESKSNMELLQLYKNANEQKEYEMTVVYQSILENRGIEFQKNETATIAEKESEQTYTPFILGILHTLLAYFLIFRTGYDFHFEGLTLMLIFLGIRVSFLFYVSKLIKQYSLNGTIWYIVTFFFGGWGLIALNIRILFVPAIDKDFTYEPVTTSASIEVEKPIENKVDYTHCPACGNELNREKNCKDCDLQFD